jgi:hypothetical protein
MDTDSKRRGIPQGFGLRQSSAALGSLENRQKAGALQDADAFLVKPRNISSVSIRVHPW